MNYRKLGKTGLTVSEVGFGAWGIGKSGWIGASDDESVKALHRAIDLGLNFIDTALGYGDGHSENSQDGLQRNVPKRFTWQRRFRRRTVNGLHNPECRWRKPFLLSMSSRVQKKV